MTLDALNQQDYKIINKKSINSKKNYKNISILCASTREAYNYIQAKQLGCDIITMPPKIINVIENFGLSLDQLTKSTVVNFIKDSKKSKFNLINIEDCL